MDFIVPCLKSINRDDLSDFIQLFCPQQLTVHLDRNFNWSLPDFECFIPKTDIELSFDEKIALLKKVTPLTDEQLSVFHTHVSSIRTFLNQLKDNEFTENDSVWWENVSKPRVEALDYFDELVHSKILSIFFLWSKKQEEYTHTFNHILSILVMKKHFALDFSHPLLKKFVRKNLFESNRTLFVTKIKHNTHFEPNYFVHFE